MKSDNPHFELSVPDTLLIFIYCFHYYDYIFFKSFPLKIALQIIKKVASIRFKRLSCFYLCSFYSWRFMLLYWLRWTLFRSHWI